jgi:lysine 2,3-aminomutase
MRPGDPADPLLRQVLPVADEMVAVPGFIFDPVRDDLAERQPGLLQKYVGRVLLITTGTCAIHCRYCFRRHFPYDETPRSLADWQPAINEIAADESVREVILSGGDPLVLSPRRIAQITQALAAFAHVKVIRVHTRVPVAAPARISRVLVGALKSAGKATYVVLHANHAKELTPKVRMACARLIDAGIPMLSQTVLLRGVNDDAKALGALMRALVECRIKPYYLHHPDLARGTAHWRSDIAHGQALVRGLRGRLSGLCQPTYVLDIPGGHGKSPIGPHYIRQVNGRAEYEIEDYQGKRHIYPPRAASSSPAQRSGAG